MKTKQLGIGILALGIFLSLSGYGFSSNAISPQVNPILQQDKIGNEQENDDGDDDDAPGIDSGGQVSADENICNGGLPIEIKNEMEPSGDVEGLISLIWEQRTLAGSWTLIPGATLLSYAPDEIYETTQYRRGARESITQPWKYSNVVTKYVVQGIDDVRVSTEDVICKNENQGSASASVTGGTAGYTFEWSTPGSTTSNIYDLAAGTYNVTVTDSKGCTYTSDDFIIEEPEKAVTLQELFSFEPLCPGENSGAIFVEAYDGTAPYTYEWSDGNFGPMNIDIPGGDYEIEVTDALGCTHKINLDLNEPAGIQLNESTGPTLCNGDANGNASVSALGGTPPYTFIWADDVESPSRNDLQAGLYEVSIVDNNGCYVNESILIDEPAPIEPSPITINNKICYASINLVPTGGNAPYTFEWEDGETTAYKGELCPGSYNVVITDANGCTKEETLNIEANYLDKSIDIQPTINPFDGTGEVLIVLPYEQPADIMVYSASGQLVESFKNRAPNSEKQIYVSLDLTKYSHGVYAVNVATAGLVETEKLIISK